MISRRDFFKLVGLSVSSRWLASSLLLDDLWPTGQGRLFEPTPLYRLPDTAGITSTLLWPDSVHRMTAIVGDWVAIEGGYVPISAIQPMVKAIHPSPTQVNQPLWAEVIAPSVSIRAYADAAAPCHTTIGHGGLLWVDHSLADDRGVWWLRTEQGWLQAAHVQPVLDVPTRTHPDLHLTLDQARQAIIVQVDDQIVMLAACFPEHLPTLVTIQPLPLNSANAWAVVLDDRTLLHGTFRHNLLGSGRLAPAGRVELSIVAARWLYRQIQVARSVRISLRA